MSPARQFPRWLLRQEVISLNNIIYDSPRLVIETKDILLPNGKERKYLFVQPVEAVCILPKDEENVYLIRQYSAVIES